jgi:hypothetical protein
MIAGLRITSDYPRECLLVGYKRVEGGEVYNYSTSNRLGPQQSDILHIEIFEDSARANYYPTTSYLSLPAI